MGLVSAPSGRLLKCTLETLLCESQALAAALGGWDRPHSPPAPGVSLLTLQPKWEPPRRAGEFLRRGVTAYAMVEGSQCLPFPQPHLLSGPPHPRADSEMHLPEGEFCLLPYCTLLDPRSASWNRTL